MVGPGVSCGGLQAGIEMNTDTQTPAMDGGSGSLLRALRWLFRPLVRLLIENGVTYPQLRELLKGLYVEVADESFSLNGKRPSDSRVFVLTGVHRKDVKRLRSEDSATQPSAFAVSTLGGELVAHWLGDADFQDANGRPRRLPRVSRDGEAGFDRLVASVSKDVRPRVILDEWLRLGVVSLDEQDRVCLDRDAFVPAAGFEEKVWFMGRHLHDHGAACVHNLLEEGPPMFERSVYYSGLTPDSVARLRELAQARGMALLQELNQAALALQQSDEDKADARHRMRFGTYWFDAENAVQAGGQPASEVSS